MGSIQEVKEALSAQARTATLDELRSRGRQQVRIIRAEQVAAMVAEAVERALANSGMVPQEDLDRLVAESRQQFAEVNRERQREHDQRERLAEALDEAQKTADEFDVAAQTARQQVRELQERLAEFEPEMELLRARVREMEVELEAHRAHVRGQSTGRPSAGVPAAGMSVAPQAGAAPQDPGSPVVDQLTAALSKLTQSMTDKMEAFGRKMGISGAVESGPVNLDGLFKDLDKQEVESNLDTMEVKTKQAGGIAANLARLKKLKGN